MDRRFDADEWSGLSHFEQVRRCQIMAEQAMKLAKDAKPNVAEGYLQLAEQWLRLAAEMVREQRG